MTAQILTNNFLGTLKTFLSKDEVYRWDELISIIASLRGEILTQNEIDHMDFFTRSAYLNQNPALLARLFQCTVETFFKVIVIDGRWVKLSIMLFISNFRYVAVHMFIHFCGSMMPQF